MPTNIKNLLTELKRGLTELYGERLKAVYLFGSYARGDYEESSDVDVMILLKDYKNYWKELRRSSDYISDLSLEYEITVSCVIIKETQWKQPDRPFLYNVRKEAVPT